MSVLYGMVGRAGAGKDTVANYLVEQFGFIRLAFADKLKQIVSTVYDVPLECFNDRHLKLQPHPHLSGEWLLQSADQDVLYTVLDGVFLGVFGSLEHAHHKKRIFVDLLPEQCSPRMALQLIGTEGFRAIKDTVWVDYLVMEITKNISNGRNIVVSDVRFDNELQAILRLGGVGIGISRSQLSEHYNHDSENAIDLLIEKCDFVLQNNSTIPDLLRNVETMHFIYSNSCNTLLEKSMRILELERALARVREIFDSNNEMASDPLEVPDFVIGEVKKLRDELAVFKNVWFS